jgi:anti-sigma B factor antagonist
MHGRNAEVGVHEITEQPVSWPGSMLAVSGELDVSSVSELRKALETLVADRVGGVVVDLSEVSFIDSLSIAAIVAAKRRLGEERRMAIVADHPYVLLIFEAGGLDSVVPLFATVELAEAHVRG